MPAPPATESARGPGTRDRTATGTANGNGRPALVEELIGVRTATELRRCSISRR